MKHLVCWRKWHFSEPFCVYPKIWMKCCWYNILWVTTQVIRNEKVPCRDLSWMWIEGWPFPASCAQRDSPCCRNVMLDGLCHSVPSLLLGLKQFWGRKSVQRRAMTKANPRNKFCQPSFFIYCERQWCQLQKGKSLMFPFRKAWKHVLCLYSWICRKTWCAYSKICILSAFLVQSQNSSSPGTFTQQGSCHLSLKFDGQTVGTSHWLCASIPKSRT